MSTLSLLATPKMTLEEINTEREKTPQLVHTSRLTKAMEALPRPKSSSERQCAYWRRSADLRGPLPSGEHLLVIIGAYSRWWTFSMSSPPMWSYPACCLCSLCKESLHLSDNEHPFCSFQFSHFALNGISSQEDNTALAAR